MTFYRRRIRGELQRLPPGSGVNRTQFAGSSVWVAANAPCASAGGLRCLLPFTRGAGEQLARETGTRSTSVTPVHFLQPKGMPYLVAKEAQHRPNTHVPGDSSACCRPHHRHGWRSRRRDQSCTSGLACVGDGNGKEFDVGQVVILTPRTVSRCQPRCRKSWPG